MNGQWIARWVYTHDDNGNQTNKETYDWHSDNNEWHCRVVGFQYMIKKGNLIEDSWWRWDHDPNEMIESGRYFYKYDFDGNLIEKYNSHGEKEYVYTYDAYGNL